MSASTSSEEIIDAVKNVEQSDNASSSSNTVDDKIKKSKTFEWFYERQFDKYFEFVKAKSEKAVSVRCLFCPPQKTLTVTTNSAYNLNIHIKVNLIIKQYKSNNHVSFIYISRYTIQN